jgi:hypothetical protein
MTGAAEALLIRRCAEAARQLDAARELLRSLAVDRRLRILSRHASGRARGHASSEATAAGYCEVDLSGALITWAGSAIVIDPGARLWRATAGQRGAARSRIVRIAPAGAGRSQSYNPLREIRRGTPEELTDFTEMAKPLVGDLSEKGECVGDQLISYLRAVSDPTKAGHLFSAVLADDFKQLDDKAFVQEMFLRARNVLSP